MISTTMISTTGLQPSPAIQPEPGAIGRADSLDPPIPPEQQFDQARSWRERLSPEFRRVFGAGQLLFQVVGVAGYAGYFASMHIFMRLLSAALMAGAWYAIYRFKQGVP
jgi:hypothetical protein